MHGHAARGNISPTWHSWCGMKKRCDNPKHKDYARYGGRGITYDPAWKDFSNFLKDMGERPEGKTLDRVNNNGPYCKENCRWATSQEQAYNKERLRANTSGVTGVVIIKKPQGDRFRAYYSDGKQVTLYYGNDFNAAVEARRKWEHGDE